MEKADRGSFWDNAPGEGHPLLFPVPATALALVPPAQAFGITLHQLADASVAAQIEVMRAWFLANYAPGTMDDFERFGEDDWRDVSHRLTWAFFDTRVEKPFVGVDELARQLDDEAPVWVLKPRETVIAFQRNAERALGQLSEMVGPVDGAIPSIGHNSQHFELLTANVRLDEARQAAKAVVAQATNQVQKASPDPTIIQWCARWLLSFAKFAAAAIATDALQSGPDGAFAHIVALAQKAGEAAYALHELLGALI